ncbi:hypothetical protein NG798_17595 [Ancylothrix sp. C2]|uniref:filament integrity protein FraC n=1 Tax=Ancylothrix sp. D3o TaxID=2953691 RepID=UPI0021BB9391|nr:filament integrity protein FraC [Ancylothrix sp. D3o]MCT7951621.1 hypothetical protein [Ancylothrix sp. D3o]
MLIPLRAILFQAFFLLIVIAIEASILYWRLKIGRKKSVEYSAAMNLFAAIFGWVVFFLFVPLLSRDLKAQIISYIFFNKFFYPSDFQPVLWLVVAAVISFFVSLFVKIRLLEILRYLLKPELVRDDFQPGTPLSLAEPILSMTGIKSKTLKQKSKSQKILLGRRQAIAILWGHATSHTTILLLLFLRNILS